MALRKLHPQNHGDGVELLAGGDLYPWQRALLQSLQSIYSNDGKVVVMELCRPPASPRRHTVFNVATGTELPAPPEKPRAAPQIWQDEAGIINAALPGQLHIGVDWGRDPEPTSTFIPNPTTEKGSE